LGESKGTHENNPWPALWASDLPNLKWECYRPNW